MGVFYSPYHAYQAVTWAMEISLEDHQDKLNPFIWDKMVIILPVS